MNLIQLMASLGLGTVLAGKPEVSKSGVAAKASTGRNLRGSLPVASQFSGNTEQIAPAPAMIAEDKEYVDVSDLEIPAGVEAFAKELLSEPKIKALLQVQDNGRRILAPNEVAMRIKDELTKIKFYRDQMHQITSLTPSNMTETQLSALNNVLVLTPQNDVDSNTGRRLLDLNAELKRALGVEYEATTPELAVTTAANLALSGHNSYAVDFSSLTNAQKKAQLQLLNNANFKVVENHATQTQEMSPIVAGEESFEFLQRDLENNVAQAAQIFDRCIFIADTCTWPASYWAQYGIYNLQFVDQLCSTGYSLHGAASTYAAASVDPDAAIFFASVFDLHGSGSVGTLLAGSEKLMAILAQQRVLGNCLSYSGLGWSGRGITSGATTTTNPWYSLLKGITMDLFSFAAGNDALQTNNQVCTQESLPAALTLLKQLNHNYAGPGLSVTAWYPVSAGGQNNIVAVPSYADIETSNLGTCVDIAVKTDLKLPNPAIAYGLFDGTSCSTARANGLASLLAKQLTAAGIKFNRQKLYNFVLQLPKGFTQIAPLSDSYLNSLYPKPLDYYSINLPDSYQATTLPAPGYPILEIDAIAKLVDGLIASAPRGAVPTSKPAPASTGRPTKQPLPPTTPPVPKNKHATVSPTWQPTATPTPGPTTLPPTVGATNPPQSLYLANPNGAIFQNRNFNINMQGAVTNFDYQISRSAHNLAQGNDYFYMVLPTYQGSSIRINFIKDQKTWGSTAVTIGLNPSDPNLKSLITIDPLIAAKVKMFKTFQSPMRWQQDQNNNMILQVRTSSIPEVWSTLITIDQSIPLSGTFQIGANVAGTFKTWETTQVASVDAYDYTSSMAKDLSKPGQIILGNSVINDNAAVGFNLELQNSTLMDSLNDTSVNGLGTILQNNTDITHPLFVLIDHGLSNNTNGKDAELAKVLKLSVTLYEYRSKNQDGFKSLINDLAANSNEKLAMLLLFLTDTIYNQLLDDPINFDNLRSSIWQIMLGLNNPFADAAQPGLYDKSTNDQSIAYTAAIAGGTVAGVIGTIIAGRAAQHKIKDSMNRFLEYIHRNKDKDPKAKAASEKLTAFVSKEIARIEARSAAQHGSPHNTLFNNWTRDSSKKPKTPDAGKPTPLSTTAPSLKATWTNHAAQQPAANAQAKPNPKGPSPLTSKSSVKKMAAALEAKKPADAKKHKPGNISGDKNLQG